MPPIPPPDPGTVTVRVRPRGAATVDATPVRGAAAAAGVEVTVVAGPTGALTWTVTNSGGVPLALDAVALVWDAGPAGDDLRLFSNGYQSWAPTRTRRVGTADPSRADGTIDLVRAAFHADPGVAASGECRSEQVAILADGETPRLLVGFTGGASHAGTVRVRIVDGRVEVAAEAWLGGAVVAPGETRALHDVHVDSEARDPARMLGDWADLVAATEHARATAPFLVGWCSWYQYFHDVTEQHVRDNLAIAGDWPFDVFQLDDGFQHAIGDWLRTNDKFPGGIDGAAAAIARAGFIPGIWIAPFLAAPDSDLAAAHPDWFARAPHGEMPAIGMFHEVWGGVMWELDTTRPEVLDHLERTAAALVAAGNRYLKLDFTFSAAMPGHYADPSRTPAERVRAGYDAIRRGAGDEVYILGCGAPLGALVGVVDAMRIGADVAPWWQAPGPAGIQQGYEATTPATQHAFVNTCTRSFMHRRLWVNDPDCVMLRTSDTDLTPEAAEAWALTVGASGGLVLASDDLALVPPTGRTLFDEVVTLARDADRHAAAGAVPGCLGLLDPEGPRGVTGPTATLQVESSGEGASTTVRAIRF